MLIVIVAQQGSSHILLHHAFVTITCASLLHSDMSFLFNFTGYDRETGEYQSGHNAPRVHIDGDKVFVEGHRVSNPITKGNTLYWYNTKPGMATCGHLSFDKSRTGFVGHIGFGSDSANLNVRSVVGGVAPSRFKTKISKEENMWDDKKMKCKASESDFYDGPEVEIGFKVVNQKLVYVLKMVIDSHTVDLHEENIATTVVSDPETHELTFSIGKDSGAASNAMKYPLQFPFATEFTISYDFKSFKGYTDLGTAGGDISTHHCWNGALQPQAIPSHVVSATMHPKAAYVEEVDSGSGSLTVMHLFALCTKPEKVQDTSQTILVKLMKAKMSSDTLKDIFAQNPPLLDPPEQAIADRKGASDFYSDFSMAFIGQAFGTTPPDDAAKLSDAERLKIKYYLQNTMPKKPAYTDQSNACYLQAFLQLQPGLKDYLDDQEKNHPEDKHYWATQLYNYITSPDQINNVATRILFYTGDGLEMVRTFSDVLHILQPESADFDPKKLLAVQYTKMIYNVVLLSQSFSDTDFVDKESKERVKEVMVAYINAILAGNIPDAGNALAQAQIALNPIIQALGGPQNWIGEYVDLMAAQNLKPLEKFAHKFKCVTTVTDKFFEKHPKLAAFKTDFMKVMYGAALVGGIALAIFCLSEGKLDTIHTIGAITELAYLGLEVTKNVSGWIADKVAARTNQVIHNIESAEHIEMAVIRSAEGTGAAGERIMAEEMSHSFQSSGRFVNRLGRWAEKLFPRLERVMKVLGPIVSFVNTVVVCDQLYSDIKGGASAAVLGVDGLQLACGFLEAAFLSIDFLWPTLCTFAGPLALAFAVIGLIAGIVSIFLPHPTPADVFVKKELRPWLDKQDDPPKGWKGLKS